MFYKKNDLKLVSNFTFIQNSSKKITSKFKPSFVLISLWYYRYFLADSWAQNRSPEGLQMTYFLKLNLHLKWVTLGDSASLVYPSIFHTSISSRFFATWLRSFKFFSKFEVRLLSSRRVTENWRIHKGCEIV